MKYHEALCLEALGETDGARKIFEYIAGIGIEYFSNMHLKQLPYWQALSLVHLGENLKAQHLLTGYRREWSTIAKTKDNGYFGTTPFFISFVDEPERLRRAQSSFLLSLCLDFEGKSEEAHRYISESVADNGEDLYALFFDRFGFLR